MNLEQQFRAAFDANTRRNVQVAIGWIPQGLLPGSELKDVEREMLFAEFVKMKQDMVAGLLNSIYKVAHTTSTVSHQSTQDSVALATKGPAKAANEKWFLEQIDRSRLPSATLAARIEFLIDAFCVSKTALPSDLDPLRLACGSALRQKRVDFKQKLRKSFRKAISETFPHTLQLFQHQVVDSIASALSSDPPLDVLAAYNAQSPGCLRFYKSIAADLAGKEYRDKYPFLSFERPEEEQEPLEELMVGDLAASGAIGEDLEAPASESDEEFLPDGEEGSPSKKRKHLSTDDTEPKGAKKPRTK